MNLLYSSSVVLTENLVRDRLQSSADKDFTWLLIMTGVVAAGVLFEAPEVLHEFRKWCISEKNERTLVPVWSLIGIILVAVGVAGEGILEGAVGSADTKIRNFENGLISETRRQTADALERAAKLENTTQALKTEAEVAKGEAAKSKQQLAAVQEATAEAERGTAIAQAAAAKAGQGAAVAKTRADEERMALLQLENDISPRLIDRPTRFSETMRTFKGIHFATIVINDADLETRLTARQLNELFTEAGWTLDPSLESLANAPAQEQGLLLEYNPNPAAFRDIPSNDGTYKAAQAVFDVLQTNKMHVYMWPRGLSVTKPALPLGTLILHVGLKPAGRAPGEARSQRNPVR